MHKKPLISICCVSYNHASFIEKCIKSLWDQVYENIEIIALDDGSKDNSASVLNQLSAQSPVPLKVIMQANSGNVGRNFNTAFKASNGDFVLFMSLDDKLYTTALSEKIDDLTNNENLVFIANSKITGINDNDEPVNTVAPLHLDTIDNPSIDDLLNSEKALLSTFYIQGTLFRSDAVKTIGGFDEDMIGDDITLRTRIFKYTKTHNKTFKILRNPSCYYRMHDHNVHKNAFRQAFTVAQYLEKYWPKAPNPIILKQWMRHTIKHSSFENSWRVFFINKRTRKYLLSPYMIFIFIKSCVRHLVRKIKKA